MLERVTAQAFGMIAATQRIGRFEVRRRLGRGGMGAVYQAWDPELRRGVAIKRLRHDLGTHSRRRQIIEAEARALAQLADRNVVQVFETGEHDGALFVVMELVDGTSLDVWQAGGHGIAAIIETYVQAGRGLAAAHRAGLVHRDVKPANVLVRKDGEVRVADFGLALALDRETEVAAPSASSGVTTASGTRAYMAPEQLAFGNADARTDQFSFCVALWEAVSGVRPFDEVQLRAAALAPAREIAPRFGDRRPPTWLTRVLLRGLDVRPDRRWASMDELVDSLVHTPIRQRRRWIVAGGGFALAIAVVAWPSAHTPSCDPSDQLLVVWSPARAEELRGKPGATEFARMSLDDAGKAIDLRARGWSDEYTAACRQTIDGVQTTAQYERQLGCFDRVLRSMDAAIELLHQGDAETLARARDVVAAIPDPAACRDAPESVNTSERDAALQLAADGGRLLVAAGRPADALKTIDDEELHSTDLGAGSAGAWTVRGLALASMGQRDEAERSLLRAHALALGASASYEGHETSRALLELYAHGLADPDRTVIANSMLDAWSARIDASPRELALVADARGLAAQVEGDLPRAEALHRNAVEALATVGDPIALARARRHLAGVLQLGGRYDEALAIHHASDEALTAALGPDHPELGDNEHAKGSLALERGDLEAARTSFERALVVHERAFGPQSVRLASSLAVLAQVALVRDDLASAESLARRGWMLQSRLPLGHPDRGSSLMVLASVHVQAGLYAEALREHEQVATELYDQMTQDVQDDIDNNLGWLLCRQGRCVEGRRHFERVAQHHGVDEASYHAAQSGLAMVELAEGYPASARARAERSLATVLAAKRETDDELIAELRWSIATATARMGGDASAVRDQASAALTWYRQSDRHRAIAAELETLLAAAGHAADG